MGSEVFKNGAPAPNLPTIGWGSVVPARGMRTNLRFADSMALRIAWGTSLALPVPKPTMPF